MYKRKRFCSNKHDKTKVGTYKCLVKRFNKTTQKFYDYLWVACAECCRISKRNYMRRVRGKI